jgi:hypothetical protein
VNFYHEAGIGCSQSHGTSQAPGPNNFTTRFFSKKIGRRWEFAILDTLNSGSMPPYLNMTHIVLIPKIKDPVKVTNFRPISLCNVFYKLISKVLANWLKKVLPSIISPTQSAFIHRRLILDNILAMYETLHIMHSKISGKKGFIAVKLNISKAYDRME